MKPNELWAVVDQGSTSTKGALVSTSGSIAYQTDTRIQREVEGDRVSHSPTDLARSVKKTVDRLLSKSDKKKVQGIGITCQRSTCLVWDRRTGEPLTEARSWQDRTQAGQARRLAKHEARVRKQTGLPLSPHYAALKMALLLESVPDGLQRAANGELVAGTLDAFLLRTLIGRDATEPSHAGRTLCFDLAKGDWNSGLCRLFGVPMAALPEILPSASRRGDYRGIPITAVVGDQQAALLGHGGWRSGVTAAHFGTGAFVLASTGPKPRRDPGILAAALATTTRTRRYQVEGSVNSAGSAVDWVFGITKSRIEDWSDRSIGPREPGELPAVLPAFAGLATPYWQPQTRAVYAGINPATSGDDLIAGTLYALASRVLDCVEAIAKAGVDTRVLRVSGKLTRLRGLVQLLADAGQVRVEVSQHEETGLLGASRLAIAGATGNARALDYRPTSSAVFRPKWPSDRARTERRRWRRFVREALPVAATRPF